jgi:hypothetical protein
MTDRISRARKGQRCTALRAEVILAESLAPQALSWRHRSRAPQGLHHHPSFWPVTLLAMQAAAICWRSPLHPD